MEKEKKADLLKTVRCGRRLKTKPPKTQTPKNVYNRKTKHKRGSEDSSFFLAEKLTFRKPSYAG